MATLEHLSIQDVEPLSNNHNAIGFVDMPPEIHNRIFYYMHIGGRSTNDNPLYKTLRQASKAFNTMATPRLFHTIVLYQHPDRWDALNSIAQRPDLSIHVKKLQLAHIPHLPVFDKAGWISATSHLRGHRGEMVEHPPLGGALADLDFADVDAGFTRYSHWIEGEQLMKQHHDSGTAPSLMLAKFGPLEVETIGDYELSVCKRKSHLRSHGWLHRGDTSRREIATGLDDEPYAHVMFQSKHICKVHLELFMLANNAALGNVTSLVIHHTTELVGTTDGLEIPTLQRLQLDLVPHGGANDYLPGRMNCEFLSQWVHKLPNLETLVLTQHPAIHNAANFFDMFNKQGVHFPKLASIYLTKPETTCGALTTFIDRHTSTIKHIDISVPIMRPSEWKEFSEKMHAIFRHSTKTLALTKESWKAPGDEEYADWYFDNRANRPQKCWGEEGNWWRGKKRPVVKEGGNNHDQEDDDNQDDYDDQEWGWNGIDDGDQDWDEEEDEDEGYVEEY